MQSLNLPHRLFRQLSDNTLCLTFYMGTPPALVAGEVVIRSVYGGSGYEGRITQVYQRSVRDLTDDEVIAGGYRNVKQLTHFLAMEFTRFVNDDDLITIVEFEVPAAGHCEDSDSVNETESLKPQGYMYEIAV